MSKRKFDDCCSNGEDLVEEDSAEFLDENEDSSQVPGKRSSLLRFKKARCDEAYLDEATTSKESNEQLITTDTLYHHQRCAKNGEFSNNGYQQPSKKKRVTYGAVSIYYFQRSQGFSCVPTSGGSTLGMARNHHLNRVLTLNEHSDEIRLKRELYVDEHQKVDAQHQQSMIMSQNNQYPTTDNSVANDNDRSAAAELYHEPSPFASTDNNNETLVDEEELDGDNEEFVEDRCDNVVDEEVDPDDHHQQQHDQRLSEYDETSYQRQSTSYATSSTPVVSNVVNHYWNQQSTDNDNNSQFVMPDDYYLQPLDSRQRRTLLRAVGIQVDRDERSECQSIRISRQNCGCNCRGQCLPATCACAVEQIKCQVDRPTFPCSCTESTCMNPYGRVEFNAVRVRTHYLHTMMRIRLENKHQTVLPSPTHIKFGQQDGYVDQQQQRDCCQKSDDLVHADNKLCGIRPVNSSASALAYRSYSAATPEVPSNGYYVNADSRQNFWTAASTGESAGSSGLMMSNANGYVSIDHQNGMTSSSTDGPYFGHSATVVEDMLPYDEEIVDVVNGNGGYHGNRDEEDDDSVVLTKMRDRSASFSIKSPRDATAAPSTYTLASLYAHQQNHHRQYAASSNNSRSHAFNEFLDPLYFPTFDLVADCDNGATSSSATNNTNNNNSTSRADDEENDTSCSSTSSSTYPSDESNNNIDDDVIGGDKSRRHVIDTSRRDSQASSPSSYLPSSPAELSAVLKKSICETVLA